jgi:hypothetical protein
MGRVGLLGLMLAPAVDGSMPVPGLIFLIRPILGVWPVGWIWRGFASRGFR